nr:MAG TPA: hypothetical protein [Caudoviricetes sp.]
MPVLFHTERGKLSRKKHGLVGIPNIREAIKTDENCK